MPEALRLSLVITYVIILVEIDRNGLEDKSKKKIFEASKLHWWLRKTVQAKKIKFGKRERLINMVINPKFHEDPLRTCGDIHVQSCYL